MWHCYKTLLYKNGGKLPQVQVKYKKVHISYHAAILKQPGYTPQQDHYPS